MRTKHWLTLGIVVGLLLTSFTPVLSADALELQYKLELEDNDPVPILLRIGSQALQLETNAARVHYSDSDGTLSFYSTNREKGFRISQKTLDQLHQQFQQVAKLYQEQRDQLTPEEREQLKAQFRAGNGILDDERLESLEVERNDRETEDGNQAEVLSIVSGDTALMEATFLDQPQSTLSANQQSTLRGFARMLGSVQDIGRTWAQLQDREPAAILGPESLDLAKLHRLASVKFPESNSQLTLEESSRGAEPELPDDRQYMNLNDVIANAFGNNNGQGSGLGGILGNSLRQGLESSGN